MKLGDFMVGQPNIPTPPPCFCFPLTFTAPADGGDVTIDAATLKAAVDACLTGYGYPAAPAGKEYNLVTAKVSPLPKGLTVLNNGDALGDEVVVQGYYPAAVTHGGKTDIINPTGQEDYGVDLIDQDCDGCADIGLADDFAVVIPDGGAIRINACASLFVAA